MVLDLLIRGRNQREVVVGRSDAANVEEFYLKSENNSYYLRGRGYRIETFSKLRASCGAFLSTISLDYTRGVWRNCLTTSLWLRWPPPYPNAGARPFTAWLHSTSKNRTKLVIGNIRNDSPARGRRLATRRRDSRGRWRAVTRDNWMKHARAIPGRRYNSNKS